MESKFTSQTPKSGRVGYSFNTNLSPRNPLSVNNNSRSSNSIFSALSSINPQSHRTQSTNRINTNNILLPPLNHYPTQNSPIAYSQNYGLNLSSMSRQSYKTEANSILSNNSFPNLSFLTNKSNSIIFGKEDRLDRMEKKKENDKIVQELGKDRRVGVKNFKKVTKYDDDEAIDTEQFKLIYNKLDLESLIDIKLSLSTSGIKLRYENDFNYELNCPYLLACISAHKPKNLPKIPIDLIIAIESSDNMKGDKLKYVKQAVKSVIMMMDENDRLSVLIYNLEASRITPLLRMTKENKALTLAEVEKIEANGGSCIYSGLNCAYNIFCDRKTSNILSEVFFVNGGPETLDSWTSFHEIPLENERNVTVHNFGYGPDHDFKMDRSSFDGSIFHYVEDLKTIDQAFLNCLGEIAYKFAFGCTYNLIPQPLKSISSQKYPIYFTKDPSESFHDYEELYSERRFIKTLTFEKSYTYGFEMMARDVKKSYNTKPGMNFAMVRTFFAFIDLNGKAHEIIKDLRIQLFHPLDDFPESSDDPKIACYYWRNEWGQFLRKLSFYNPHRGSDGDQEATIRDIRELEAKYSALPYKDHPLMQRLLKEMSIVKHYTKSKRYKNHKHPIISIITHSHNDQSFSFHTMFDYSSKIQKFYQSQAKSFVKV